MIFIEDIYKTIYIVSNVEINYFMYFCFLLFKEEHGYITSRKILKNKSLIIAEFLRIITSINRSEIKYRIFK